jgi:hypothetical protein
MLPPSKLNWQDKSLVGTAFFGEFGAEIHDTDTQSSFEWLLEIVQMYIFWSQAESLLANSHVPDPSIAARPIAPVLRDI